MLIFGLLICLVWFELFYFDLLWVGFVFVGMLVCDYCIFILICVSVGGLMGVVLSVLFVYLFSLLFVFVFTFCWLLVFDVMCMFVFTSCNLVVCVFWCCTFVCLFNSSWFDLLLIYFERSVTIIWVCILFWVCMVVGVQLFVYFGLV